MKLLLENINSYYLIEITRVDNNRLLRSWKAFTEEEAETIFENAKADAQEEANLYETLIELTVTLMGEKEEELISKYFDSEQDDEELIEMESLTEAVLNKKLNLS